MVSVAMRVVVVLMAAALLGACAVAVGSLPPRVVELTVTPRVALVDRPVSIVVSDVAPGSVVTLTASTTDQRGRVWRSSAIFPVDSGGDVVVSDTPSLGGSYSGTDGMGLFESMRRIGSPVPLNQQTLFPATVARVRLIAVQGGVTVARATLIRRTRVVGVTERRTTVTRDGFVGCYSAPKRAARRTAAIVLIAGTASGPPCGDVPSLLASHGYPTLAVAYLNVPGLPAARARVPLEHFRRALGWLDKQPGVDPKHLVTLGIARGAEAALLLGTTYPSVVHGAASYLGGDIVGVSPHAFNITTWTLRGRPLPRGTVIPIWKINGPLFFVGATGDSSSSSIQRAVTDLRAHHRQDYTTLVYKGAGHALGSMVPNLPSGNTYFRLGIPTPLGGTPAADAHARTDSWPKLLAFLKHIG